MSEEPCTPSHSLGLPKAPPDAIGLYDPSQEHDACGVGFIVDIKGRRSHAVVRKGLEILINLLHRGACGCEVTSVTMGPDRPAGTPGLAPIVTT
mgnify:CR=1 FL=1